MSCDIGLIGIAVMGENLVLNLESKGFKVAVFNRTSACFLFGKKKKKKKKKRKIHFFFFFSFFLLLFVASKVDEFVNGRGKGKNIVGCHSLAQFAEALKLPRKAMVRFFYWFRRLISESEFNFYFELQFNFAFFLC
jgi:6-phosphogluconate dehydrogenase